MHMKTDLSLAVILWNCQMWSEQQWVAHVVNETTASRVKVVSPFSAQWNDNHSGSGRRFVFLAFRPTAAINWPQAMTYD